MSLQHEDIRRHLDLKVNWHIYISIETIILAIFLHLFALNILFLLLIIYFNPIRQGKLLNLVYTIALSEFQNLLQFKMKLGEKNVEIYPFLELSYSCPGLGSLAHIFVL